MRNDNNRFTSQIKFTIKVSSYGLRIKSFKNLLGWRNLRTIWLPLFSSFGKFERLLAYAHETWLVYRKINRYIYKKQQSHFMLCNIRQLPPRSTRNSSFHLNLRQKLHRYITSHLCSTMLTVIANYVAQNGSTACI